MESARERLGRLARARRQHLGWTQEKVRRNGGPNLTTVGRIERGVDERISDRTRRLLEDALGWQAGTVDAILGKRLAKVVQQGLITGPDGAAGGAAREDDRELLARVSDAALLEELARRLAPEIRKP